MNSWYCVVAWRAESQCQPDQSWGWINFAVQARDEDHAERLVCESQQVTMGKIRARELTPHQFFAIEHKSWYEVVKPDPLKAAGVNRA